ncbi:DNA-3-methyladenine glycosylase [soil metagenome]
MKAIHEITRTITKSSPMPPQPLNKISLAVAAQQLAKRDKELAAILTAYGPPPLWARTPGFATLVQIILEQQVSLASAASIYKRLRESIQPFRPDRLVELGEPHLKLVGLTRQKTAYCIHLAESINSKSLNLRGLSNMSDDDAKSALMQVKGIGSWSADIYLLMVLRRPDIWPAGDLALATAVTKLKRLQQRPTTNQLFRLADRWRPFRSVAARMLWQYYLARRKT